VEDAIGIGLSWIAAIGVFLLWVYWVAVVIVVIADDREPSSTLAWLLIVIALPVIGLVFYFFLGRNWKKIATKSLIVQRYIALSNESMRDIYARNAEVLPRFCEMWEGHVAQRIAASIARGDASQVLPADSIEIFSTGAEKFARLKEDLARAERFIHLQYFIWEHDELTAEITAILLDRLSAGVTVRVMYDFVGSLQYNKEELHRLKEAGAQVSADIRSVAKLNYRNHRKIVVIDGVVGYTGGMNMGIEYVTGGAKYPLWRDTHVRVTGQIVAEFEKLLARRWYEMRHDDLFGAEYMPPPATEPGQILMQVASQGVEDEWEVARRAHFVAITGATRLVRLQSPYFVPDPATYDALVNAALSGVQVQVMMTGWPDKKVAFYAAQSYWHEFVESGGELYLYDAGFLHAKTLSVDEEICAIGTMNLDIRSLRLHKELMLWVFDPEVTARQDAIFDEDLSRCHRIDLEYLIDVGTLQNFRNSACRLLSNVL